MVGLHRGVLHSLDLASTWMVASRIGPTIGTNYGGGLALRKASKCLQGLRLTHLVCALWRVLAHIGRCYRWTGAARVTTCSDNAPEAAMFDRRPHWEPTSLLQEACCSVQRRYSVVFRYLSRASLSALRSRRKRHPFASCSCALFGQRCLDVSVTPRVSQTRATWSSSLPSASHTLETCCKTMTMTQWLHIMFNG